MPHAGQAIIDLLTEYFAAMQAKDIDRMRSYYSDDMTLTFPTRRPSPAQRPCWRR